MSWDSFNAIDPMGGAAPANTGESDYASAPTRETFSDPRFLNDLREEYRSRGVPVYALSDDELIERFVSDGTWGQLNTVSAAKDFAESRTATAEERARQRRLANMYQVFPNFWEEGGRGASGFFDGLTALVADPVNLVGGIAAKGASQAVTRGALAAGQTTRQATRAGVRAGVGRAAATEGAIGAGAEATIDALQQGRDINLGLQDEFSYGQLATSAALGGGIGAGAGALLSAPAALAGARLSTQQIEELRGIGLRDEQIAQLTNQQATDILTDPEMRQQVIDQQTAAAASQEGADSEGEPRQTDQPEEQETDAFDVSIVPADLPRQLNREIEARRDYLDRLVEDGADPEEIEATEAELARLGGLRAVQERLLREQEEIVALEQSNEPEKLAEGQRRRQALERDLRAIRTILRNPEGEAADRAADNLGLLTLRPEDRVDQAEGASTDEAAAQGQSADTEAAPTEAEETASGEVSSESAAEAPPVNATEDAQRYAEEFGVDLSALAGRGSGKDGRIWKQDVIRFRREQRRAAAAEEGSEPLALTQDQRVDQPSEPLVLTPDQRVPAAPEGAQTTEGITPRARAYALQNGIDWREISAEDGKTITTIEVNQEIARRRENAQPLDNDYARQASEQAQRLADLSKRVVREGDTYADWRSLMELVSQAEKVRASGIDRNDLLALFDENVRAFRDRDELPESMFLEVRSLVEEGDVPRRSDVRTASARYEQAGQFSTAGQTNEGGPQSFLRQGTPIAKGSDYTLQGAQFPSAAKMGFDEAMERARLGSQGDTLARGGDEGALSGSDLVPFRATGRMKVYGPNGITTIKKGETAFADGVTGKAVADPETAYRLREFRDQKGRDIRPDDREQVEKYLARRAPTRRSPKSALRDLLLQYQDDPDALLSTLEQLEDERPNLASSEAQPAQRVAEHEFSDAKQVPLTDEDGRVLIVRSLLNPADVRMASKKQIEGGKTLADIIGKTGEKSRVENWEVGYAPTEKRTRSAQKLAELFDSPDTNKPFGTSRAKEADQNVVETGKAANVTRAAKTLDEIKGMATRPLTEVEAATINAIAPDGFKAVPNEVYDYPTLVQLTHAYEVQGWKKVRDPKAHADRLAQLYDLQAATTPDGLILPNETREEAVEAARTLMGRYSPEEGEEAARLIGRLGGDRSVGPMFRQNPGGGSQYRAQYVGEPDQAIELGDAEPVVTPRLAQFYHEVAHWAYMNVLTPQDRLDFWRSMSKYYKSEGEPRTRKIGSAVARSGSQLKSLKGVALNAETSPQELFANMFEMWAARRMPDSLLQDQSYWKRIARYVKAVFDRYVRKVPIDPDLEPLFAKILPDEEQQVFQRGVAPSAEPAPSSPPKTPKGVIEKQKQVTEAQPNPEPDDSRFADFALSYYHQLRAAKEEIEAAIENEQYETLFEAMKDLNRIFLSLVPQGIGKPPFGPAKRAQKLIRQRQMGIFEIMSGSTTDDPDKIAEALVRMDTEGAGSVRIRKPEEMYAQLVAFYYDGHAPSPILKGERFMPKGGKADPETGAVTLSYGKLSGTVRNPKAAAVRSTIATTMKLLQDAYTRKTGLAPSGEVPASVKGKAEPPTNENGGTQAPTKAVAKGKKRKKRLDKATDKAAKADASTPPNKRKTKQSQESDPALADELKSKSIQKLRKLYRKHRGTDRGTQVAHVLVQKQKATDLEDVIFERTPISKEVKNMKSAELEEAFLGAVYDGDSKLIDQTSYELRRRTANKRLKASAEDGQPPVQIKPIISKVTEAIRRERTDSTGVASHDGIPPAARATIREMLSYMTHRDPEIEVGMRTMTYRMLNLLDKTVRDTVGEANVITASDVARLANANPDQVGSAVFADFRAPEFKQLRSDLRRMTIGLNKGEADPFDLMHELGHTLVRSGALPDDEVESILEAYRATNDTTRQRVEQLYRGKYADRNGTDLERALAEEWFSERLAQYMGERVSRGDILQASIDGDITRLTMRGKFDRAIDRLIEYIAYVVNGVIGRRDIKQTFRRLMFYGDMLGTPETRPLADASGGRMAVSPQIAAAHSADVMASSPRARMQKILSYVGNGAGFDEAAGEPVVFYHGTPRGRAFDRQANPNIYMKPSQNGDMGPGIYITENPDVADEVYSRRPTLLSLERQFEELGGYDLPEEQIDMFEAELRRLHNIRTRIRDNRQHYTQALIALDSSDPITQEILAEDVARLREDIDADVLAEESIMDEMRRFNLEIDPLVMPTYARVMKPANFQTTTSYAPDDAFVRSLVDSLVQTDRLPARSARSIMEAIAEDGSVSGSDFYKMLTKGMELQVGSYSAKKALSDQLQEMGYDGMETTHVNLASVGGDSMPMGGTYAAEPIPHRTLVVFDPENVKHIEAAEFDQYDARLFHRDNRIVPAGLTGGMLDDIISENVESLSDLPPAILAENAEKRGTHNGITSAMMSMMRGRDLSSDEQDAMFRAGARGLIMEQSTRMKRMGMNWIADWYKGFFPDTHQRFAKKFMPIRRKLRDLPDAHGKVRQWAKNATASVWQEQPKSHARITRALRYGLGSRQEKALTDQEREIFMAVRDEFRRTREELVAQGVFMGDRGPDYLPQVWSKDAIAKDREDFLNAMVEYFQIERAANGQDFVQEEANAFAERMYDVLAGEDSDGVFIPIEGGTRNPQAEHVDFGRMIELDKYPTAMKRLEKYLESDLEALLVKYFEGATRRVAYTEHLGVNGHALYDYLKVVDQGVDGIAELLSKNKEFKKSINFIDDSGSASTTTLKDVVRMPFEGSETTAREFAQQLVEASASGGEAAARRMLMEVAPTSVRGDVPKAYLRRADAIVGALRDYNGQRPKGSYNELNNGYKFIENAMRAAMRKRQIGVTDSQVRVSNALRTFNNVTLLGFTTLTSLGDLALPIIRSGSMRDYVKALKNFASDPEYAELINNTGVAIENIVHDRMIHLFGGADNKLSNAFFNATMLTPWTDTMRRLSGGVGYESFKTMQKKAFRAYKPGVPTAQQSVQYKTAARYLRRYGLGDFLPDGARSRETLADQSLLADDAVLRNAVLRFADEAIFTPNPNDVPLWAQTPVGQIIFQLKTFPLMMGRMTGYIIEEANKGNVKPLLYFATLGPAFGAGAMSAKDIVQMRGGEDGTDPELRKRNILKTLGYDEELHGNEDDFLGWYVEGMMQMGGLGLMGDLAHNVLGQVDNGAYGQVRLTGFLAGPSYGAGVSAVNVLAGAKDAVVGGDNSNAKERSATRELALRVPVVGGVRSLREGIVDTVAGEARDGSTGGWASEWSGQDWTTSWE